MSIAVDTVTKKNKLLKEYYNSVNNKKGSGRYSHVPTMKKLIGMIFTMLKEKKEWR